MRRRAVLGGLSAGLVAGVAAPAVAQSLPEIKWRMTSSFPKSLDTIYGTAQIFAQYVAEATDNRFQIQTFAAGEIVPGLAVLESVGKGTVELGHSAGFYYLGQDPSLIAAPADVAPAIAALCEPAETRHGALILAQARTH